MYAAPYGSVEWWPWARDYSTTPDPTQPAHGRFLLLSTVFLLCQAREAIARDPSLLEFQLELRVLPRLEAVRKAGIGDVVNGAPLSLDGKLKVLGKFSDARFHKWLKREGGGSVAAGERVGPPSSGATNVVLVDTAMSW